MVADRIVSDIFPDGAGAARLAQVGLFILIFVLGGDRAPVTPARLAELTGQPISRVQKQLHKLIEAGVIERKKAKRRGHGFHLAIKADKGTKRFLQAMSKAAGRMAAHIGRR
jgi:predicted transcriptional regulator